MATTFPDSGESHEICQRIRSEYLEMPGLVLTAAQARRLWRLDPVQCEAVLALLVREGFLECRSHGYVRPSAVR